MSVYLREEVDLNCIKTKELVINKEINNCPDSDDLLELVFIKRYILILLVCSLFVLQFKHNSKYFAVPV